MPDVGYYPDNYCWKHYCFEYRLATPPAPPAKDRDSIDAALQRLADFDTSSNDESEDK